MEKVKFELEDGNEVEFYVEEQTRVNGRDYLLVSDSQDDEAQAYILKDMSAAILWQDMRLWRTTWNWKRSQRYLPR